MPAFNQITCRAVHNSYSGNISGQRGSIVEQLNAGVRVIELDLYATDFDCYKDYRIGHSSPGDAVWLQGGNPTSVLFTEWLNVIASRSRGNAGHAPIQILLDLKQSFDLPSASVGNYAALNDRLLRAFGSSLLTPGELAGWPDVSTLTGKVYAVLSSGVDEREPYILDRGMTPAVAVNSRGQVVEVHESQQGNHTLWYWTGMLNPSGGVTWKRHGRYGTGTTPAVALNDAGFIVEVHKSENHDRLWSQVGRLTPELEIEWQDSHDYDNGISPTIRFKDLKGTSLREIHRSESHAQNWGWQATLETATSTVTFADNSKTSDPLWTISHAPGISVETGNDAVLLYTTPKVEKGAICYEQLAFAEYQSGDPGTLHTGARFAAAPASAHGFLADSLRAGLMTRGWQFSVSSDQLTPPESFPATDTPYDPVYENYCLSIGAVK